MTLELTRSSETRSVDVVFAHTNDLLPRGTASDATCLDGRIAPIDAVTTALSHPRSGGLDLRVMGPGAVPLSADSIRAVRPRRMVVDGFSDLFAALGRDDGLVVWARTTVPDRLVRLLAESHARVVCNSNVVRNQIVAQLGRHTTIGEALRRTLVIHDPIPEGIRADEDRTVEGRLVTLRTPNTGLGDVLDCFAALRRTDEDLSLHVVARDAPQGPGSLPRGVKWIVARDLQTVIGELREASALFHPTVAHPETSTMSIALANGVGTPALVHADGVAVEAVSSTDQLLIHDDVDETRAMLGAWTSGPVPPPIDVDDSFRLEVVARKWRDVLG